MIFNPIIRPLASALFGLFVVLGMLTSGEAMATHLVGGELYYTHLGGNDYRITLKVYRDCDYVNGNVNGTDFDDEVYIGVWDGTAGIDDIIVIPKVSSNVSVIPVVLSNPCGTPPPTLCVDECVYSTVVNLPPDEYGWDLIWQRCCRNPTTTNLQMVNTFAPGATLLSHIPGISDGPGAHENSAPVFEQLPPVAVCANFEFIWDHSATDADGDELVYSFCAPSNGGGPDGNGNNFDSPIPNPPALPPYQDVPYVNGFSATYPITSDPELAIDPATGLITGTPTAPGQYAIGICVSEYRNGVLLNTTTRDFQFNITLCDPNIQSVVAEQTPAQLCIGETITMDNNSVNGTDYAWDFGVAGTTTDVSTEFEPTFTWPAPGNYTVSLVVNPGWPCADTSQSLYQVWESVEPNIVLDGFSCQDGTEVFGFAIDDELFPGTDLLWNFNSGTPNLSNLSNPTDVSFGNDDAWSISVNIDNNGCTSSGVFNWTAPPDPVAVVEDQYEFCTGLTFEFENLSSNADAYLWDFGDGFGPFPSGTSTDPSPIYTFPDTGTYTITLTAAADYTCPVTTTGEIDIHYLLDPQFESPDPQCFDGHVFAFSGVASVDVNTIYEWDFDGPSVVSNVNEEDVLALVYQDAGIYDVSLTASVPGLEGCIKTFTSEVTVLEEPTVAFEATPWSGCPPHAVNFTNLSTTETATTYTWHFGNGVTSNAVSPIYVFDTPGTYPILLEMETSGYCVRSLAFESDQSVEVLPVPLAAMDIDPNDVDIINPVVWVSYLGNEEVDCYYNFGDGTGAEGCDLQHTYNDGGTFDVVQTVTNGYGCSSVATGQVNVGGSVFYAPTAFTPDGDGLNEVWLPSVRGVTRYDLRITNRWGELVFATDDPEEPWLGQVGNDGKHYCPNGSYVYQVVYEDQLGYPRTAEGHVLLLR